MAWIFLAESEESQSPSASGCAPSPIAKLTPIVKESSYQEWRENYLRPLPFGQTFGTFLWKISQAEWTSYTEAFHARISLLQAMEKAWKESAADYSSRSCAWPKKSSPRSYSLRMSQQSQAEADFKSLEKLPKWSMIVDGVLYPLLPLEQDIKGIAGSYWLTPSTMDHLPVRQGEALENALHRGKNRISRRKVSGRLNEQVAYPQMWPTPDSSARGAYKTAEKRTGHHFTIQDAVGSGKLNPMWVEWLMGYPKGHTELEPWAMQWYLLNVKGRLKS